MTYSMSIEMYLAGLGLCYVINQLSQTYSLTDRKPFNCEICLSTWISLILLCITFEIFFLSLPITYKLITSTIRR